jgi:hypothetical protein
MNLSKISAMLGGVAAFMISAPAQAAGSGAPGAAARPSTANLVATMLAMSAETSSGPSSIAGKTAKAGNKPQQGTTEIAAAIPVAPAAARPGADQIPSLLAGPAQRAFGDGTPESHVTTYGGFYNANKGYADRYIAGSFIDLQLGSTGLHADVFYVDREQNAAYGAFGVSQVIEGFGRVKVMAGTSSHGQDIVPKLFLSAGLELQPGSQWIVRPAVAYRKFRNDRSQVNPSLQVARYFGGDASGYFVAQADASLYLNNVGNTGWSVGGGLTHVSPSGWRFGAALHRGYMTYDAISGTNVHSSTYGGGPNFGYRFSGGQEIFFRSDLTKTRFYTVSGAIVGFKFAL